MKFPTISDEVRGQFDEVLFASDVDEEQFRQYSRDNDPPQDWEELEILHPFCRDEWFKLGKITANPAVPAAS